MHSRFASTLAVIALAGALASCSNYREGEQDAAKAQETSTNADDVIANFKKRDPSIQKFFDQSYAYAVFPKIAKGAVGIGAADGDGLVYEQGRRVGTTGMTQVSVGFQLGGQTYSELIFFQNQTKLDHFKSGNMEFAANASAIAAESGAAASNDFHEGVAVFTLPRGGLMFEASIGGQKFSYHPLP